MTTRLISFCTALLAFGLIAPALGQTADGSPARTPTPEKFIFYWGTAQAALTADNQYRAEWTLQPKEFRQMLLQVPYLWNGRAMAERVAFRLNGLPVIATRGQQDYEASAVELYERFSDKIAHGQIFFIADLALTPERVGAIDIRLEEPPAAASDGAIVVPSERYPVSWLNKSLVASVQWGLERHEVLDRDFFTPREALEILRQQPVVEWQPHLSPQPVYADVQITQPGGAQHGSRVLLSDPEAYQQILHYARQYRFLLRPGALLTLSLYSSHYERLYEHILRLVDENDPRLALRRHRDAHRARLQWGPLMHEWTNVYLTSVESSNGKRHPTDLPYVVRFTLAHASLTELSTARPLLWVDETRVTDLAFSLSVNGNTIHVSPDVSQPALPPSNDSALYTVRLHDLQAAGYDLAGLAAAVTFIPVQTPRLPQPADAKTPTALTLYLPTLTPEAAEVTFYLPEAATLSIDVKDGLGTTTHTINGFYSAGRHSISLPRRLFRTPGRYVVALKTPYGEAQQPLEIP